MPVIRIYGISEATTESQLNRLTKYIQHELEEVPKFLVSEGSVSVFYPNDRLNEGLGTKIVALAVLREKPKRTEEVLNTLARTVVGVLKDSFPSSFVECFVTVVPQTLHFSSKM